MSGEYTSGSSTSLLFTRSSGSEYSWDSTLATPATPEPPTSGAGCNISGCTYADSHRAFFGPKLGSYFGAFFYYISISCISK